MNVIVSFWGSIPPPTFRLRLSKDISLNLDPITGSNKQPDPLPPTKSSDKNLSNPKSCGSTKTCLTLPITTGSTLAPVPVGIPIFWSLAISSIVNCGGFTTSYPLPPLRTSNSSTGP